MTPAPPGGQPSSNSADRSRMALRAAWSVSPCLPPATREPVETVLGYAWQALEGSFPPRRLYGYLQPLRLAEVEPGPPRQALDAALRALSHATAVALEAEDDAGRPGLRSVPDDLAEVSAEDAFAAVALAGALPQRDGHDEHPWLPARPAPIPPYGSRSACADPWLDPDWAARLAFDAWASAAGRGPADPDDPFWARIWEAHGGDSIVRGRAVARVQGGVRIALDGGPAFLPDLPGPASRALPGDGAFDPDRDGTFRVAAFHPGAGYVVLGAADEQRDRHGAP